MIAKPASSAEYHYAEFEGKKKVFKFDTMDQLKEMLSNLEKSSYGYKFLIQDFIPGDDNNMHILTCYVDRNHKVRFMAFGKTIVEDHGKNAIGNPVAIINQVNRDVMDQSIRFLESTGYTGFANLISNTIRETAATTISRLTPDWAEATTTLQEAVSMQSSGLSMI